MWKTFIKETGRPENTPHQTWHFCDDEASANALAELTLKGIKQATASLHAIYAVEGEPVPKPGDLSVITNWDKEAVCIIETKSVEILPFGSITEEHARIEGEGDKSLAYWRAVHEEFFTREAKEAGLEFSEESLVVFETFAVVYPTRPETK
jgi:uncharacterized protein YhfF